MRALATKYRPKSFDEVVEQDSIKVILQNQLKNNDVKSAYLFVGGAGTGKTTCARIFANEINHGKGNPIEMDAASNSGVEDVRNIIQQAQSKSIDSDYKVFIIDECHSISNTGWQAFLKLLEEPPATSIFIFCTTNPEKIPKTILSRVQRYDFQRISTEGIRCRLIEILLDINSNASVAIYDNDAIVYIAKLADGGMRDAITMLDQCLSYSDDLTVENVQDALGLEDIETLKAFILSLCSSNSVQRIEIIESVYQSGKDLKQFIKSALHFVIDIVKINAYCPEEYIDIPITNELKTEFMGKVSPNLIGLLLDISNDIKWEANPKMLIEAYLLRDVYDRAKEFD